MPPLSLLSRLARLPLICAALRYAIDVLIDAAFLPFLCRFSLLYATFYCRLRFHLPWLPPLLRYAAMFLRLLRWLFTPCFSPPLRHIDAERHAYAYATSFCLRIDAAIRYADYYAALLPAIDTPLISPRQHMSIR